MCFGFLVPNQSLPWIKMVFQPKHSWKKMWFNKKVQKTRKISFFNQKPKKRQHGKRWWFSHKPKMWKQMAFQPKTTKRFNKQIFNPKPKNMEKDCFSTKNMEKVAWYQKAQNTLSSNKQERSSQLHSCVFIVVVVIRIRGLIDVVCFLRFKLIYLGP